MHEALIGHESEYERFREAMGASVSKFTEVDIMRYLVSRKFNVDAAVERANNYLKWHSSSIEYARNTALTPANILEDIDDQEDVYREHLPHANLGHAKNGSPIYWEKTGLISYNFSEVKKHLTGDDLTVRHIRQQEYMFQDRMKRASEYFKKDVHKQILVADLTSLSFSLDTLAMSTFRRTVVMDEQYYPERVDKFFIINAPWYFTALWAIVRPWLDPITAEKVQILGSDFLTVMEEYIDRSQIPTELGGDRENFAWTFPDNRTESDEFLEKAKGVTVSVDEDSK